MFLWYLYLSYTANIKMITSLDPGLFISEWTKFTLLRLFLILLISWETLRRLPTCAKLCCSYMRMHDTCVYTCTRKERYVTASVGARTAKSDACKCALTIPRRLDVLLWPCRVKGTRKLARPSYYVKPLSFHEISGARRNVTICFTEGDEEGSGEGEEAGAAIE